MAAATLGSLDAWLAYKARGDLAFKQGAFDLAAEEYTGSIDSWGQATSVPEADQQQKVYANRCLAFQRVQKWQESLEDAKAALQLDPAWLKGWFRLGAALLGLQLPQEAIIAFETGLELDGGNVALQQQVVEAKQLLKAQQTSGRKKPAASQAVLEDVRNFLVGTIAALKLNGNVPAQPNGNRPLPNGTTTANSGNSTAASANGVHPKGSKLPRNAAAGSRSRSPLSEHRTNVEQHEAAAQPSTADPASAAPFAGSPSASGSPMATSQPPHSRAPVAQPMPAGQDDPPGTKAAKRRANRHRKAATTGPAAAEPAASPAAAASSQSAGAHGSSSPFAAAESSRADLSGSAQAVSASTPSPSDPRPHGFYLRVSQDEASDASVRQLRSSPVHQQSSMDNAASMTLAMDIEPPAPAGPKPKTPEEEAEELKAKGNAEYKEGRYTAAYNSYSAAIAKAPNAAAYYGNRAAAAMMLRNYKVAADDSTKATQLDASYHRGYVRAAKAYLCMGKLDMADRLYEEALQQCPPDGAAQLRAERNLVHTVRQRLDLGRAALARGDPREAQWHADAAVRAVTPSPETAILLRCEALLAAQKHAEALSESRGLTIEGDAQAPEVLTFQASALYLSGNMTMAQKMYEAALSKDPDMAACKKGLKRLRSQNSSKEAGNTAFKLGRWQEAYDHYTTALEADPHLRTTFVAQCACNRAATCMKLSRHEEAVKDANMAVEADPGFTKGYLRRGNAYLALEQWEDAVRDFEKVKDMDSSTPDIDSLLKEAKLALKKSKRVDYYKLLEVSSTADETELKKAYRRAALKFHPDKVATEEREAAEKQFKLVGEAHAVLADPEKRQKYDQGWTLEEIDQGHCCGGHGAGGGVDMDDLFAHMFAGGMFGGGGTGGGRRPRPGGFY